MGSRNLVKKIFKDKEFAIALIMGENDSPFSLEQALVKASSMDEAEFKIYSEILDQQIEILHSNIYNSNFLLESHIKKAVEIIERCQLGEPEKKIVEMLKNYIVYEY